MHLLSLINHRLRQFWLAGRANRAAVPREIASRHGLLKFVDVRGSHLALPQIQEAWAACKLLYAGDTYLGALQTYPVELRAIFETGDSGIGHGGKLEIDRSQVRPILHARQANIAYFGATEPQTVNPDAVFENRQTRIANGCIRQVKEPNVFAIFEILEP